TRWTSPTRAASLNHAPDELKRALPASISQLAALSAHYAARFRGVMISHLFLVLFQASVELVGQQIDRGVHILVDRFRMDRGTAYVQRRLGLLSQLFHRQYAVHIQHLIVVPADALEFLFNITPH